MFSTITRTSLDVLNQSYRVPGILPGGLDPGRGAEATPDTTDFKVADEFIRAVSFEATGPDGRPYGKQFIVRLASEPLDEPDFTERGLATPWDPGTTTAFGQELGSNPVRFKKVSLTVRTDELMVDGGDSDEVFSAQVRLASVAIVRSLSEAVLFSPATDAEEALGGLPTFLTATQDVTYVPSTRGMIGGLSEIEAKCHPSDGDFGAGPDCFVLSSRARWRLLKELEDKGVTPDFRLCDLTGRVQLHFHGIPVLMGRVPERDVGGTARTDAWALKLRGPTGVRILHVGGDSKYFGVRAEPTATVATLNVGGEAVKATRGIEVYGVYSVLVPEPYSIARLNTIPAALPF